MTLLRYEIYILDLDLHHCVILDLQIWQSYFSGKKFSIISSRSFSPVMYLPMEKGFP